MQQLETGDGASRDAVRFRALYEAHVHELSAYCARRVGRDRVDDAVADTFLVAWRRIHDVPDDGAALLWLYGVAHRIVSHEWRSGSRRLRVVNRIRSLRPNGTGSPEDFAIANDENHRVLDAVSQLSANDREILRLVAWERLSPSEISAVLGISTNAVHQRLHRARRNLNARLDRLDDRAARAATALEGGAS